MKKILFTDLFGTLINSSTQDSKECYNSIEKEYSIVSRYMNEFLDEGNYIAIVTEPGGHGNFGRIFNNQIAYLNSFINEDLRSHLAYYMQGKGTISPEDRINKKIINGKMYYIGEHSFKGIAVNKKEEAVTDFLQTIMLPYQIYGIGDSMKDIPMLLKIQEFGGKSSIIDMRLYSYQLNVTTDDIINNELIVEFDFKFDEIYKKERKLGIKCEHDIALLLKKRRERKKELYQLLNEGKLDLNELMKNYSKFIECQNYKIENEICKDSEHPFYENYPISEEVIQRVMALPCYTSFTEYYTKVLKKR